jgi:hypothetical protein
LSKSIIFFLFLVEIILRREKARLRSSPAGFKWCFDLSGRLVQATTVRRHGDTVMVVMTVMAAALHLSMTLRGNPVSCQMR